MGMLILKIVGILLLIAVCFFLITFVIYFFNLDMKLMAALTGPMTKYYDWSAQRREKKAAEAAAKEKNSAGQKTPDGKAGA